MTKDNCDSAKLGRALAGAGVIEAGATATAAKCHAASFTEVLF
jgi:hypothetical protein